METLEAFVDSPLLPLPPSPFTAPLSFHHPPPFSYLPPLPPTLLSRNLCSVLGLYCLLGFVMDGPAYLMGQVVGIEIIPCFDCPWMVRGSGFHAPEGLC